MGFLGRAGRGLGVLFALLGLWIWWRALDFTMPERGWSMPQLRLPVAGHGGAPMGLSLLGPAGSDRALVAMAACTSTSAIRRIQAR